MCCENTNCCCTYTGATYAFLGVESGDTYDEVVSALMSYIQNSSISNVSQGLSGTVLFDEDVYTTPSTVSNIPLDLQNLSDEDTYSLDFIIIPNYTNLTLEVLGLAFKFVEQELTLTTPYKVNIKFTKKGSNLVGNYTIQSISTTIEDHESFEGEFISTTLLVNPIVNINIAPTHSTQTVNTSEVKNIHLSFLKKLT